MAQDLEQIINLLREMRNANSAGTEALDRLLKGISAKIDSNIMNQASKELLKSYVEEISRTMANKYDTTLNKFADIEQALITIYNIQKEQVKNSDLKELFNIFSSKFADFFTEIRQQKVLLSSFETKLSGLASDETAKDDILRSVTLMRTDFENLNNAYKDVLDDMNSSIRSLMSGFIRTDQTEINNQIKDSVESIGHAISGVIETLSLIKEKENYLESVLHGIVTKENLKESNELLETLISKTDNIFGKIESLPNKYDTNSIQESADLIIDKLNDAARDADVAEISEILENLYDETEEVKKVLGIINENIEDSNNTEMLETSFAKLYSKLEELLKEISSSTPKEGILDLQTKVAVLKDEFETIKSIISDLEESIKSKITAAMDKAVTNEDLSEIQNSIKKVLESVPDREEIDVILEKFYNKHIEKLDEISKKLDNADYKDEFDNLYRKTESIESMLAKVDSDGQGMSGQIDKVESHLISISDFMKNELKVSEEAIKSAIIEIRGIIESNKSDFEQIIYNENNNSEIISQYITGMKDVLNNSGVELNDQVRAKLSDIEETIHSYSLTSKSNFDNVLNKLDEYEKLISNATQNENLSEYTNELSQLKSRIAELGGTFRSVDNSEISNFVSKKFDELSDNVDNLIENIQNGLQQGFAYNSELIEEKSQALLDVIKQERHSSTGDIELFEKFTVADAKLMDIKQEIELVNTDIASSLNALNEFNSEKLADIESTLNEILKNESIFTSFKTEAEDLFLTIKTYLGDNEQNDISSQIEDLHNSMLAKIKETNNDLKDFILGDIDSVIIKLGDIKEELEAILSGIVPPNPEDMKEFHQFVKEIADFRISQKKFYDDIKKSVEISREELKSMVTVALNDSTIIQEIKKLDEKFRETAANLNKDSEGINSNEFDKAFNSENISSELQTIFLAFESKITELSGQNKEITSTLSKIKDKLQDVKISEDGNIVTSNGFDFNKSFDLLNNSVEELSSKISKIILPNDSAIDNSLEKILEKLESQENENEVSGWLEKLKHYIGNDDISKIIKEISGKIDVFSDTQFFELEQIKDDIDALNLDCGSTSDQLESIKTILEGINTNINEAAHGNKEAISGIDNGICDITKILNKKFDIISSSDEKMSSMLEMLNHKIDIIAASSDNADDLEEVKELILSQQEYLQEQFQPGEKTEALKNCLDELAVKVSNLSDKNSTEVKTSLKDMKDSIMAAVVNIFSQVSFIEESEDIKDFVEEKTDTINRNLELVTEKLKQIANVDEQDSGYTYSMQDIETDLTKLRIALKELQETGIGYNNADNIEEYISKINETVDLLSPEDLKALKTDVSELREQTSRILQVSDESFLDIREGMTSKVDNMTKLLEQSAASDKVMRQALIYMGEWIDSTSNSINKISQNSEEIANLKNMLEMITCSMPNGFLSSIEENLELQQQRLSYFEKQIAKIGSFESIFEQQEKRIDRLEMNIDKILSAIENIDDAGITRKIEKIEKQINKLSVNIDKLASYVD